MQGFFFNGVGQGTARGGVPSYSIAAYKVCDRLGCVETDILAAFDDAIADRVDIIIISVGRDDDVNLTDDALAISAFHGHGVQHCTVVGYRCSKQYGPAYHLTRVVLGNGTTLVGNEVNSFKSIGSNVPLIYGKDGTSQCDVYSAKLSLLPNSNFEPDISAPGVDILAAFSAAGSVTNDPLEKRSVKYSFLSVTSMSCPHVAGATAYVKTFHPNWSPSAIKSALMTTAWPMNSTINPEREFTYGAGHIDPVKAVNPGLVYETFKDDYVNMLCNMGYESYDPTKLKKIVGDNSMCATKTKQTPRELNYPSMAALHKQVGSFTVTFTRTVTNVGLANSTHQAKITPGSQIDVKVEPSILSFKSLNEKKSFVVTATGTVNGDVVDGGLVSASLVWSDSTHIVGSPIAVYLP